jgi:hypothetical protein
LFRYPGEHLLCGDWNLEPDQVLSAADLDVVSMHGGPSRQDRVLDWFALTPNLASPPPARVQSGSLA